MPKTDVKKIESEDVAELSDEVLDRLEITKVCTNTSHCGTTSPAE